MSEYQYYEFQAVDRRLDASQRAELRAISSRARITTSRFVNTYDWGDLKAEPLDLLKRYFDLFLYHANWGTRWFAVKLPKGVLDLQAIDALAISDDVLAVRPAGAHVILSMQRDEVEFDFDENDDEGEWLSNIAPLRTELLSGDLRLFPLLWLIDVETEAVDDDALEPAPGVGPLSPALSELAKFLDIDPDLLEAAAQSAPAAASVEPPAEALERAVRALSDEEKVVLLIKLASGEAAHASAELRRRARASARRETAAWPRRTAGELRRAAQALAADREQRAKAAEAERLRRLEKEAARAREQRLSALASRKDRAWSDVETAVALGNAKGYAQAADLLSDMHELARRSGTLEIFVQQVARLRARHAKRRAFLARLDASGVP